MIFSKSKKLNKGKYLITNEPQFYKTQHEPRNRQLMVKLVNHLNQKPFVTSNSG